MKTCSVRAIGVENENELFLLPLRDTKRQNCVIIAAWVELKTLSEVSQTGKIKHHRFPPLQNINRLSSENKQAERARAGRSQRGNRGQ